MTNIQEIFQWTPKGASLFEKSTAAQICRAIDNFRGQGLRVAVVTEADTSDSERFWSILGGKQALPDVKHKDGEGEKVELEENAIQTMLVELFIVELNEDGHFKFNSVQRGMY